jgi:hypothetical protein
MVDGYRLLERTCYLFQQILRLTDIGDHMKHWYEVINASRWLVEMIKNKQIGWQEQYPYTRPLILRCKKNVGWVQPKIMVENLRRVCTLWLIPSPVNFTLLLVPFMSIKLLSASWSNTVHILTESHSQAMFRHVSVAATTTSKENNTTD